MDKRKGIQEPTQEAAQAVKEKEKKAEQMKKKAHKRQKQATTGSELDDTESGDSHKEAAISKESAKKKGRPKSTKKAKEAPVLQGRRQVPNAGDGSGCKHHGLRELVMCEKAWMRAYVKIGGWLHNKPCVDCAAKSDGTKETGGKVMDASALLLLKQDNVAYICNCGPIGHKMMEDEKGKEDCQCDMMLCLPCHSERENKLGTGSRSKRKRNPKTRH